MPINRFIASLGLASILCASTAHAASIPANPAGRGGAWRPVFSDNFDSPLNNQHQFAALNSDTGNNVITSSADASIANGALSLWLSKAGGSSAYGTGGSVSSSPQHASDGFDLAVGEFVEARVDFPGPGTAAGTTLNDWPTFAASSEGNTWPVNGEEDIFTGLGNARSNYYSGPSAGHQNPPVYSGAIPGNWSNGYHIYGLYRGAGSVDVYYDGTLVDTYQTHDAGGPQQLVFTAGSPTGPQNTVSAPSVTGAASAVNVDWVRAWQPTSTVTAPPGGSAPGNSVEPALSGGPTRPGGVYSTTKGAWTGSPTLGYRWEDCTSTLSCHSITGAISATYTATSADVGSYLRAVVTATNSHGTANGYTATSGQIAAQTAVGSGPSVVGAPGPAVSCSRTLQPGADVSAAVTSAAAGSVICLAPGDWSDISIASSMDPSSPVTLAAQPGQTVTIGQFSIDASVENLTVQGLHAHGFSVDAPSTGGITFRYDTVRNVSQGVAFQLDSAAHGNTSGMISGVTMSYNQIDHVGQCLADVYNQQDTTFSHNVCGPGIGAGAQKSTDPGHYIETGGENNLTVVNNAFLGSACSCAESAGLHLNVMHDWGDSTNVTFANNVMWHVDAIGQALLFQSGHFDNVQINNNLDVDDPDSDSPSYAFWTTDAHGLSFEHNTVAYSHWGNLLSISQVSEDYPSGTGSDYTIARNVVTNTGDGSDMDVQECASDCAYSDNVTDDDSAPGSGSVTDWTPRWATTSWTPGATWTGVPAGYYQPVGLAFSAGYQGTVGP